MSWPGVEKGDADGDAGERVRVQPNGRRTMLHSGLLELLIAISNALAVFVTPHEPSVNGHHRPTFSACLQTTKNPEGPVNTPQQPVIILPEVV
jgi:hypothetical protein